LDFRFVPFATHDDGDEDDVEIEEYDWDDRF
jgi:cell cycle checkpoint protein